MQGGFTLEQMFYGMMLPSGNDAAYTIAEYVGNLSSWKGLKEMLKVDCKP